MTPVFLVKFDLACASAMPFDFDVVTDFAGGDGDRLAGARLRLLRESATGARKPAGSFVGFNLSTWYGLADAAARALLDETCARVRYSPVGAVPRALADHQAFFVDRVVEDALDLERSDLDIDEGMWRAVRRVVLKRDLADEGFFRLRENDFYLLCTERVVKAYEARGLSGLSFAEVFPNHRAPAQWYRSA
ncbi:MAG: hypothetical protein IAE78_00765 [Myxococcus sp.]|nr:hypothetical protein [Myxococcus sp.]